MDKKSYKLNWQAYTSQERNQAIDAVKNVINQCDAYIINHNLFSDLAMSLTIEIEENTILDFYKALECIVKIDEAHPIDLNPSAKKEWWIFLNLSFSKGKGKLKVEIPNVPG
jgi:hypothetical protein